MPSPNDYLVRLRAAVAAHQPAMLPLFETMAGEAVFARAWMAADLAALPRGAAILEVGGGTFVLSCLLAEEGFAVTSIEPVGDGFGEFRALAEIVLATATAQPTIAAVRGEDFASEARFDFAFSVNVMEHVESPADVIARVMAALKPNAAYRFFCPNYLFPYEPHFNIPILFTKDITQFVLHKKIHQHPMPDPLGAWGSLNWITVPRVQRIAREAGLKLRFNTDIFAQQWVRMLNDPGFAARRGAVLTRVMRLAAAMRLHRLVAALPAMMQPTMDVTLSRSLA